MQLCFLELAGITAQHAVVVGVRGAVVVAADDPKYYGGAPVGSLTGKRKAEVDEAVDNVLRLAIHDFQKDLSFSGFAEGTIVKATLVVDYKCEVPVGRWVVCGSGLARRKITREASMPAQTPGYQYP